VPLTLPDFLARLTGVIQQTDGWKTLCPAHEDRTQSLTVKAGTRQPIVLHCHAGCATEAILGALGLGMDAISHPQRSRGRPTRVQATLVAAYDYRGRDGVLRYQSVRFDPKAFRQRRPDPERPGEWIWKMKGVELVPYRLDEVAAFARMGQSSVVVTEGEKDADRLWDEAIPATTNVGGAGKWTTAYSAMLKDAGVTEIFSPPDNDEPGRAHAAQVIASCREAGIVARLLALDGLGEHEDVSDFLDRFGVDAFRLAMTAARVQDTRAEPAREDIGSHWTDYGHAVQFVRRHGQDVRYTQATHWRVWTQGRFRADDNGSMAKLAKAMIRTRYEEATALDPRQRAAFMEHLLKTESQARIEALLASAQSEPEVSCVESDFDGDPHLFNVRNGTLDLRTLRLLPHRREDLITKLSPVVYDPDATCPRFTEFLTETFPSEAVRQYVQRLFGYALCGDTEEQCYFIFHGTGQNGKSTLTDTMLRLMGEYAHKTQVETLLASRLGGSNYQNAMSEMAALQGVRLALASEPEMGRYLAESFLKDLTGGEQISARLLYREPFKYSPQFKLILSTNTRPPIQGTDTATWRRIRLVPFVNEVPEWRRDKQLKKALWRERSGILNWALAGYRQWQELDGLSTPPEIETSTQEYRESEDSVQSFVDECCDRDDRATVAVAMLYDAYVNWARRAGERAQSKKAMGLALDRMGFRMTRDMTMRLRRGLVLKPTAETFVNTDGVRKKW
jgi:putative DNA primase/helicase